MFSRSSDLMEETVSKAVKRLVLMNSETQVRLIMSDKHNSTKKATGVNQSVYQFIN